MVVNDRRQGARKLRELIRRSYVTLGCCRCCCCCCCNCLLNNWLTRLSTSCGIQITQSSSCSGNNHYHWPLASCLSVCLNPSDSSKVLFNNRAPLSHPSSSLHFHSVGLQAVGDCQYFLRAKAECFARLCHRLGVCPSVCLSVCHTRELYQNGAS